VTVAVPEDAEGIVIGVTLEGRGAVRLANPRLEVVEVAPTPAGTG
jgi:hypothetical protein